MPTVDHKQTSHDGAQIEIAGFLADLDVETDRLGKGVIEDSVGASSRTPRLAVLGGRRHFGGGDRHAQSAGQFRPTTFRKTVFGMCHAPRLDTHWLGRKKGGRKVASGRGGVLEFLSVGGA